MYMRKSRLSKSKQDRLIEHFVAVTTARCAAGLVGINFKTAAYYYHHLRMLIFLATENESTFYGEIKVYTKVTADTKAKTLMGIMQKQIKPDSIVYTDHYRSYNVFDVSEFKHYRINHSQLFADQ
jgi:transposase